MASLEVTTLWAAAASHLLGDALQLDRGHIHILVPHQQRVAVLTQRAGQLFLFLLRRRVFCTWFEARMERDDTVLVRACG